MKHIRTLLITLFILYFDLISLCAIETRMQLCAHLSKARPGDYLVTTQHKNFTILIIRHKSDTQLAIDEITLPMTHKPKDKQFSWKKWVENGALANTCWLMYVIDLNNGAIQHTFSFTRNEWISIPQSQDFLSTLLSLHFQPILEKERKKVGPPPSSDSIDRRPIWQPPMIVEGIPIKGVTFTAWRTHWPKDNSELSNRVIEIYLPKDSDRYPTFFPYWLQIHGMVGKAKVRIIDAGSNLSSPARLPMN